MIIIPIVFAFDNNWTHPASVCLFSLLANAKDSTTYDVYILYPKKQTLDTHSIKLVFDTYPRHKINYIGIGDDFAVVHRLLDIGWPKLVVIHSRYI